MQVANASKHRHHAARLNRLIQTTLIAGLSISMFFMLTGTVLHVFHDTTEGATSIALGSLLPGMASGHPLAYMVFGLIVLMVTPALRVIVAAVGYILERDWIFALICAGMMAVLAASVLIGAA